MVLAATGLGWVWSLNEDIFSLVNTLGVLSSCLPGQTTDCTGHFIQCHFVTSVFPVWIKMTRNQKGGELAGGRQTQWDIALLFRRSLAPGESSFLVASCRDEGSLAQSLSLLEWLARACVVCYAGDPGHLFHMPPVRWKKNMWSTLEELEMTDDIVTGIAWACILTVKSLSAVSPHSGKEFKVKQGGLLSRKQNYVLYYRLNPIFCLGEIN